MKPFIEGMLSEAFAQRSLILVPARTPHVQILCGQPDRRFFYVKRRSTTRMFRNAGVLLPEYDYSDRFPWPRGVTVRDPVALTALVEAVASTVQL